MSTIRSNSFFQSKWLKLNALPSFCLYISFKTVYLWSFTPFKCVDNVMALWTNTCTYCRMKAKRVLSAVEKKADRTLLHSLNDIVKMFFIQLFFSRFSIFSNTGLPGLLPLVVVAGMGIWKIKQTNTYQRNSLAMFLNWGICSK